MSEPLRDSHDDTAPAGHAQLPIAPDVDAAQDVKRRDSSPFDQGRRSQWPRLRLDVVAAVFVGGCAGGYARYAASIGWPTPTGRFPWATFGVNVAGSFVLTLVVIVGADLTTSRYLRPLVGTGFCGALTTFSSVVVTTDQLVAHHHPRTATAYLLGTVVLALAAASLGLVLGRAIATNRRRARHERNPQ